ncbi:uncharacterized protein MYCGRDRAFT_108594 [Zymoseptoria tritici IPO323]|uniref:Uncharacterized protein n=1 Tax=Zymoseptoria tritici (strain CBS 115943 / IPO323) TaxID=336722 RepID=F9X7U4_ZYMTI|nr:uncharacterized protein MYCGRDRAFT_108594 [Zymoseptoria tritici IPO323]EGP88794.1 hypothetical protein MYCGRDRAFT_108594 [Zymoseptoria tritici IPO323]
MSTQNQPMNRRPSWAKNKKSYRHYLRTDLAKDRTPGEDYGLDNFSYDHTHVPKWQLPHDIMEHLPDILRTTAKDWQLSGAAVNTALDRIKVLEAECITRGYPDKTFVNSLSRRVSDLSPSTAPGAANADTPPMYSPVIASLGHSNFPNYNDSHDNKKSFDGIPPQQQQIMGMESPPFTPLDSQTCSTPEMISPTSSMAPPAVPDPHALTRQISTISTRSRNDSAASSFNKSFKDSAVAAFDERAWDIYIGSYEAELVDIKTVSMPRLRGQGILLERYSAELIREPQWKAAITDFMAWFATMKPMVADYDRQVKELELPSLEYVRLERTARGMSI